MKILNPLCTAWISCYCSVIEEDNVASWPVSSFFLHVLLNKDFSVLPRKYQKGLLLLLHCFLHLSFSQHQLGSFGTDKIRVYNTSFCKTLIIHWTFGSQKGISPLRISSENLTKSEVSCRFGHIYWKNL